MDTEGLPEIKDILIARVQPGDKVILRVKERIPMSQVELLWQWLHELFPDNKVGVIDGGDVEIEIIRPEQ